MPSVVSQKRHFDEDEDSSEHDQDHDDSPPLSSPPSSASASSKRARIVEKRNSRPNGLARRAFTVDEDGDEDGDEEMDGEQEEGDGDESVDLEGGALPPADTDVEAEEDLLDEDYEITADDQEYQAGSIVRIKLINFVTYTSAEIRPGPSLNMIIGPNGTGKSTIVCAICLGLGWNPAHLGRAKEVSEFVKHGFQDAFIEIELQGRKDERNPVIKRKISRENNGSTYYLNGRTATHAAIQKLTKGFNIQIDNLCQFLPQDRVNEFAHLSDSLRLIETERAAAGPEMLGYHKKLMELWKAVAGEKEILKSDKLALQQLEARQAVLQQDVDRLRERQEVMANIELLQKMKPYIKYREARAASAAAKQQVKNVEAELQQLKAESGPAMERPKHKKRYKETIQRALEDRQTVLEEKQGKVHTQKTKVIPQLEEKIKEVEKEIKAEHAQEEKRKEQVRELKRRVESTKKKLDNGPPEIDVQFYNDKLTEKRRAIEALQQQMGDIQAEFEPIKRNGTNINAQLQREKADLQRLESVTGQRETILRDRLDRPGRETYEAWQWYQEHRDEFEQEVFPPAVLCCSVKDSRAVDAIESLIRGCNTAFLCQNTNDYERFTKEVIGVAGHPGLGLANITIKDFSRSHAPNLENQQRPHTKERLAELGFEGVALDFIEAPDPVLNMLCHESHVHRTPMSAREFTPTDNQRCETAGLNTWIAGKTIYQFQSRYGVSTTKVTPIRPARIYKTQQVDQNQKREKERKVSELEYQLNELKGDLKKRHDEHKELLTELNEAKAERQKILTEKTSKQDALGKYNKLKAEYSNFEEKLKKIVNAGSDYQDTVEELEAKLDTLGMKRAQAAIDFVELVGELVDVHNKLIQLRLRYVEAASDEKLLNAKNEHIIRRITEMEVQLQDVRRRAKALRVQATKDRDVMAAIFEEASEEDRQKIGNLPPEKTVADVEDDIETEQARLELIHEGNPNALKQYEERKVRIENLTTKIAELEEKLEEQNTAIREVQEVWEPELDALIAKISAAFSKSFQKIGCAGEVRIFKSDEGFDKWAAEILVKFREGENFQVLNAQRQSGGERAVSTVFYLMALQSMAKSPFRVVDEINQGMDPRNERVVHHRMVNIACQEHTSQYFLITPKLLSDLMYHPRMKVHCIYSGEWVTDVVMDFDRYLQAGRRLKASKGKAINGRSRRSESAATTANGEEPSEEED